MADVLILFGFSWMVAAAIIGLLLAKRHEFTLGQLKEIADQGNLAEYHRVSDGYKWNKTVHAHAFLFSVVAVSVGLAMSRMGYSQTTIDVLAIALIVSAVVWTVGGLLSNRPLMAIGDLTLLLSTMAAAIGLAKSIA